MPLCQLNWRERMEKIKPSLTSVFFILLALSLILSCFRPQMQKTQAMGVYHRVKKNETVWMIAERLSCPITKFSRNEQYN